MLRGEATKTNVLTVKGMLPSLSVTHVAGLTPTLQIAQNDVVLIHPVYCTAYHFVDREFPRDEQYPCVAYTSYLVFKRLLITEHNVKTVSSYSSFRLDIDNEELTFQQ